MAWAPDYLALDEAKDFGDDSTTVHDVDWAGAITASCRAIDDECNRQFGQVDIAEERAYTARYDYGRGLWVVDIDDVQDTTGLAVTVGGTAVTLYTLGPANAVKNGMVYTLLVFDGDAEAQPCGTVDEVLITALWGWSAVPAAVVFAAKLQTNRMAERRNSPYGVAGSPTTGSELRLLARLDPDVAVSLRRYKRRRKAG